MDDDEATKSDEPDIESATAPRDVWAIEPTAPTPFEPPPAALTLPPPAFETPTPPDTTQRRRFPWVALIMGAVAAAAIVVLALMFMSASNDKDDAEQALAATRADLDEAQTELADSEAALKESEGARTTAESDLSATAAELAETEAARAEADAARADAEAAQADAEAARDEQQQEVADYAAASSNFLAASFVAGLGLEQGDAQCVAEGVVAAMGADAMAQIAGAALDGVEADELDAEMRNAADDCGVSIDEFEGQVASDAFAYGDDPELDALYDACAGGDAAACDDLYLNSAAGSDYEQFAGTCGNRFEYSDTEPCAGRF